MRQKFFSLKHQEDLPVSVPVKVDSLGFIQDFDGAKWAAISIERYAEPRWINLPGTALYADGHLTLTRPKPTDPLYPYHNDYLPYRIDQIAGSAVALGGFNSIFGLPHRATALTAGSAFPFPHRI
jgi:hypothetical protein